MGSEFDRMRGLVEASLLKNFNQAFVWFEKDGRLKNYKPANAGWSIAQVLEHISLTNHYLLIIIDKATAKSLKRAESAIISVPVGCMDELRRVDDIGIHKSFDWIRPEHMEPVGTNPEVVLERLHMQLDRCLADLKRLMNGEGFLVNTTMSVNALGKINVYQYLYFLAKHIERHITQMERIECEFSQK